MLPEEVVPAEELGFPGEALVGEGLAAVHAAHAGRVPRALQHLQQELVQDGLVAARARHHRAASRRLASPWTHNANSSLTNPEQQGHRTLGSIAIVLCTRHALK